jgi:uncharacterized repeat protein (TIGR01451 family)
MSTHRGQTRARRGLAVLFAVAIIAISAQAVTAVQTFPDPFGGDGLFVDIRAGSKGDDIGDAFFLRDDEVLSIEMFLDAPNTFVETHVCLSAEPFTGRIPPGQCQYQEQGPGSGSYDIVLPPAQFPDGTVPFSDPLQSFCAQVHVSYDAPGLARTDAGGGSAFAGWQAGKPFYGNVCFPAAPEPPPSGGTAEVTKQGALVDGDVVFTVTVSNPTTEVAPDVVILDALPVRLEWTVPPECSLGPIDIVTRCELGDLPGGASVELIFSATPLADVCGTFTNHAATFVPPAARAHAVAHATVDVPCPPDPPPDPLILLTKEASATTVTAPGTILYVITFENAGPGSATNVTAVDELPPGPEWSIGSGSNVCTLDGTALTCFAASVADGVFEVLEITGTVDAADCGTLDNEGTVTFSGGHQTGSVTAAADPITITGCPTPTPTPSAPSASVLPSEQESTSPGSAELPDTRAGSDAASATNRLLAIALLLATSAAAGAWSAARIGSRRGPFRRR